MLRPHFSTTVAFFLLFVGLAFAEPTAPLSVEQRRQADRAAKPDPTETKSTAKPTADSATLWLLTHAPLPPAAEKMAVDKATRKVLLDCRSAEVPAAVDRLLKRLADQAPRTLRPESGYVVSGLDVPHAMIFGVGGGRLIVSRPSDHAIESIEFVFEFARQLAHDAMGHYRSGHRRALLESDSNTHTDAAALDATIGTRLAPTKQVPLFQFSAAQELAADRFAWRLCRLAGFESEEILDVLRRRVLLDNRVPKQESRPSAAARLHHLLGERDGRFDETGEFGLFVYDRTSKTFARAADHSVPADSCPIVLVHGLGGSEQSFADLLKAIVAAGPLKEAPILAFRHPPFGSLERAAVTLKAELARVCAGNVAPRFVAHSAGGLVVRFYHERMSGPLDRAIFLGTPHHGSAMVRWHGLLDLPEALRPAKLPLPQGAASPPPGAAMIEDLTPDSLFLRLLGNISERPTRYHAVCGRCLSPLKSAAAPVVVGPIKSEMKRAFAKHPSATLREHASLWVDAFELPDEVTLGDGCVALTSARPPRIKDVLVLPVDHFGVKSDPEAVAWTVKRLALP